MKFLLASLVALSGLGIAFQTAMNGQLRSSVGHGLTASWLNFWIGIAMLSLAMVVLKVPLPSFAAISAAPWWAWGGGLFGAFFILMTTIAARDLGVFALVVLVLLGQAVGSVFIDHFGWMGVPTRPVSTVRIVACVLLIFSMVLLHLGDSSSN